MNTTLKPLTISTLAFFILFAFSALAQTEIKLRKGEKVKKENNLYGILYEKEWTLPCKYEKLEAYAWNYLFAYAGNEVDVYRNWSHKRELLQAKLPVKYVELYKSFANKNIDPLYDQGKWGFFNEFYRIEPRYDSIYVICTEGSSDDRAKWRCDDVVGVIKNGVPGVVKNDGKEFILHPDYVSFRARFTGGTTGKHEVIATHKSGVEVIYYMLYPSKNEFITTTGKNNLKGYVSNGNFIEPKYTAINKSLLPIADYEGVLPNGEIEYLKGAEIVPVEKIAEYKEKKAKEEQLRKEEELKNQKAKEHAAKTGLTVEVKTKNHTLTVYPGWAGIFKNPEKETWLLRSDNQGKKPAEIFKEAPDGWLKDAFYVYPLSIKFEETENFTLEKNKQDFIELAMRRSKLPKEKIKLTEEQFTLPDGRKAMVLFYVCADAAGMVGGNYVDCDLSFISEKSPTTITSYTFFIDGGAPDLPQQNASVWKDYFKNVLLSIRPN